MISVVMLSCCRAILGVEIEHPENPEPAVLSENFHNLESTHVRVEIDRLGWIKMHNDWCLFKDRFQSAEFQFGLLRPLPIDLPPAV